MKLRMISSAEKILSLLLLSMVAISCTKEFDDINTNKNAIAEPGPAELPFLFSRAESAATHSTWTYQIAQNLFADQYAQYFASTATYFNSDRLVIRMDWVPAAFNPIYTDVVPQLQTILERTDPSSAENALAHIWWVWTFHRVTDYWGPIPYSKAGIPGISVPYDAQDVIYADFFKRLDEAVKILEGKKGEKPYGSFDLIYAGDVEKWIKFANTLRLRLALRISKVDPAKAKSEAEAAYSAGVMDNSATDDALIQRSLKGENYNGLSIMSDWNEFRMSASMESVLKGYDDPRTSEYFLPAVTSGTFEGLRNGLTPTQQTEDINKADANSHVGDRWLSTGLATHQNVMCTAEAYFLRAEGALNGWNMGGNAKELYEAGITNSMKQWGITNDAAIQAYISSSNTPVAPNDYLSSPAVSNIPVSFVVSDVAIQREQIATQKWLGLFPDGFEAWAEYRRTRLPKLYPVANSENPDITNTATQIVRRIPFITTEILTNGPEVEKAVQLLNGPDKVTTPLWWDKN